MKYKFFSGFSLQNEESLFDEYRIVNDFTIAGFSYGAIKAFEYVLQSSNRIDTLQLFSPAFFQDKDEKYKRMQVMFFKKDETKYCNNFIQNVAFPCKDDLKEFFNKGTSLELETLLNYVWDEKKLQEIKEKNINIEVYLGSEDKIIDSLKAKEFFKKFATVYYIKKCGHILKRGNDE